MVFLDKKWKPFLNPLVDFRTYQVPTFLVFNNHFQYFLLSILEELSSYSDNILELDLLLIKQLNKNSGVLCFRSGFTESFALV